MEYAKRVLIYQVLSIPLLIVIGLFFGAAVASAMFIGAAIGTAGTWLFARAVFKPQLTQNVISVVERFYTAELHKLLMVMTTFVLTFILVKDVNPIALLGAYFVSQVFPPALAAFQSDNID